MCKSTVNFFYFFLWILSGKNTHFTQSPRSGIWIVLKIPEEDRFRKAKSTIWRDLILVWYKIFIVQFSKNTRLSEYVFLRYTHVGLYDPGSFRYRGGVLCEENIFLKIYTRRSDFRTFLHKRKWSVWSRRGVRISGVLQNVERWATSRTKQSNYFSGVLT